MHEKNKLKWININVTFLLFSSWKGHKQSFPLLALSKLFRLIPCKIKKTYCFYKIWTGWLSSSPTPILTMGSEYLQGQGIVNFGELYLEKGLLFSWKGAIDSTVNTMISIMQVWRYCLQYNRIIINNCEFIMTNFNELALHKASSFPLRISPVNKTKSADNFIFWAVLMQEQLPNLLSHQTK